MLTFLDDCRTANIIDQTIVYPSQEWHIDPDAPGSWSELVPVFYDTVDDLLIKGLCGEKVITLDTGSGAYLTVTANVSDAINNDLVISYDQFLATEYDI